MIDNISQLPIVIVANYRTGSSSLGRYLAQRFSVDWLPEPFHDLERRIKLQQCHSNNTKYVTKFIVDQIPEYAIHQTILESDCFKIRLSRQNLLQQVASYYIAFQRNLWKQEATLQKPYTVTLDHAKMQYAVDKIVNNNLLLKNLDIKFDLDLVYEDLDFSQVTQPINQKTTQPVNIDQVLELAQQTIIDQGYDCSF